MNKQDIYTLCTLIPSMDDYSGHNMYLCGKRDGFNECVQMLKENLESISEEQGHESGSVPKVNRRTRNRAERKQEPQRYRLGICYYERYVDSFI